jgi:hypothetical protein
MCSSPRTNPPHGAYQVILVNGCHDSWCYLLLVATLRLDETPRAFRWVMRPPPTGVRACCDC